MIEISSIIGYTEMKFKTIHLHLTCDSKSSPIVLTNVLASHGVHYPQVSRREFDCNEATLHMKRIMNISSYFVSTRNSVSHDKNWYNRRDK